VRKRLNNAALYLVHIHRAWRRKKHCGLSSRFFHCVPAAIGIPAAHKACLEFQIGRCFAPCKGLIDEGDYGKLADNAVSFLQGRRRELISNLKKQMEEAAEGSIMRKRRDCAIASVRSNMYWKSKTWTGAVIRNRMSGSLC